MSQDSLLGSLPFSSLDNYLSNSPNTQNFINDVLNDPEEHGTEVESKEAMWDITDSSGRRTVGTLDIDNFHITVEDNEIPNILQNTSTYEPPFVQVPAYYGDELQNVPLIPDSGVVPANSNWPGNYNFGFIFDQQPEKTTKSTSWTYSESLGKLFVVDKKACPIKFHVDSNVPPNCYIRALPLFTKSEHLQEAVKRCPNHSAPTDLSNQGHEAPEHLVRCSAQSAIYQKCINGRLSVVVPYESPQAGSEHTTYLYEFMCYNSCVGGLNRRPIQVVFTLENNGHILGRLKLPVRICACPGRDRKSEEKVRDKVPPRALSRQTSVTNEIIAVGPAAKKRRAENYVLQVSKLEHYEILKKIKRSLELADLVTPDALASYQAKHGSEDASRPSTSRAVSIPVGSEWEQPTLPPAQHVEFQNGNDLESSQGNIVPCSQSDTTVSERFRNIKGWLASLGLTAYVDKFHHRGYMSMKDVENITLQDLNEMKIGEGHRNILWKSLVEYRIKRETSDNYSQSQSQGQFSQASNASDLSGRSTQRRYTVTRYRYTHKIDYCSNEEVDE